MDDSLIGEYLQGDYGVGIDLIVAFLNGDDEM